MRTPRIAIVAAALLALGPAHSARAAEARVDISGAGAVPLEQAKAHTFPAKKADEKKISPELRKALVQEAEQGKNDYEGSDIMLYIEGVELEGVAPNQLVLVQVFVHDEAAKDVSSDHFVGEISLWGPHHQGHKAEPRTVVFELEPRLRKELAGADPSKAATLSVTFFAPQLADQSGKRVAQKGTLAFKKLWVAEEPQEPEAEK